MREVKWLGAFRAVVLTSVVLLLAAVSSGALSMGVPSHSSSPGVVLAWDDPTGRFVQVPPDPDNDAFPPGPDDDDDNIDDLPEPDNVSLCAPRRGPLVQSSVDPSGRLRVTITAATGFDNFPIALRRLRIGPSQNAAIDIGPHVARTDPFYFDLVGVQSVSFTASRVVQGQPIHIPLLVFDDCDEWRTFAGAGIGVALPAVAPTATAVPCPPLQPCGSIPIDLDISPTRRFPPGTRIHALIRTRPQASCELRATYPGRPPESLGVKTADGNGICQFDIFVPFGLAFGDGLFTGVARDMFGTNLDTATFVISGTSGDNFDDDEDDDNIAF